ncbi:recombinase family protein [Flavobacteriaceae bacterium XHP0103]|uniref:recombinase family protein n=1 Tax=Marixanthotalea marina TaxID=2844359 RepID=UPI002989BAED|nr:recombinase family protein [Marixanthotalea marina]MBU3822928.1 recombinase family protein [Marixanthotalea marina]
MNDLEAFKKFSPAIKPMGLNKDALIYTRVSTKDQADNTSLETQKKYCENYAKTNGLRVVAYFGGTHESAKSDDRKEFKRMLKFAKQSKSIGYIIVYSYDRFSRTGSSAAQISHELLENGIQVKAVTQEVDATSPSGKFQQNLFYMFSQFDNELRRDKTITAMKDLVKKGHWLWTPPKGYCNKNKYHKAVDWDIVVNKDGLLLKKAFKWKADNVYSNAEIVRRLRIKGMDINEKRLGEIFKNPFYCGVLVCNMLPGEAVEGKHEAIVSKSDFLKINTIESKGAVMRKTDNDHLPLKRFAYCDSCKTPLTGFLVKQKGLYYYKCRTKGCSCSKSAKQLHENFIEILSSYQVDPKYFDIIIEVMTYTYDSVTKEIRDNEIQVKKQLSLLNRKIETIEERHAIGEIDIDIYKKFKAKYSQEQKELELNLSNSTISSSNLKIAINKALKISSNLSGLWASGDLSQKKKLQFLVFPSGIGYDKSNGKVQTKRVNSIFSSIPLITKDAHKIKNGESINLNQFSARVTSTGFKPVTF